MLKRIMPTAPPTITLQEAACQLGLHYMTVYRYVRTGKLAGHPGRHGLAGTR